MIKILKAEEPKVNLRDWNLASVEELPPLKDWVLSAASEAIELALKEPADVYFPFEWGDEDGLGGEAVNDPLLLRILLPFSNEGEEPFWEFDLRKAFDSPVELYVDPDDVLDDDGLRIVTALRDALLEVTTKLTAAIDKGRK